MKNGKSTHNEYFKKGTLFKEQGNIYIIVGIIENQYNLPAAAAIRVRLKNGRFNIKRKLICWRDSLGIKETCWYKVVSMEEANVDKRDQEIFKDFVNYIKNNDIKVKGTGYKHYYFGKDSYSIPKYEIFNLNLKKYKKYSNLV